MRNFPPDSDGKSGLGTQALLEGHNFDNEPNLRYGSPS